MGEWFNSSSILLRPLININNQLIQLDMTNYIIAKKDVKMNNHWTYALSVDGRKAFEKGNKDTKMQILMDLLSNGNITMYKLIELSK